MRRCDDGSRIADRQIHGHAVRGAVRRRWAPGRLMAPRVRPRVPRELKRYLISGCVTAGGSFLLMTVFVAAVGLPTQIALALTYGLMLVVNFTMSRQWVWVHESGYTHRLSAQGRRYLVVSASGYALTALALATLPEALDVRPLVVYFPTTLVVAILSFICSQVWVFRSRMPRLLLALLARSRHVDD
jgi:putative flippase GtrA